MKLDEPRIARRSKTSRVTQNNSPERTKNGHLRLSDAWIFWLVVAAVLILFFALGFFVGWEARP